MHREISKGKNNCNLSVMWSCITACFPLRGNNDSRCSSFVLLCNKGYKLGQYPFISKFVNIVSILQCHLLKLTSQVNRCSYVTVKIKEAAIFVKWTDTKEHCMALKYFYSGFNANCLEIYLWCEPPVGRNE